MSRHASLLLMASLIILEVGRSISGSVRLKVPTNSIKWDHNMLKRSDENMQHKRYPRVRMVKRALRIDDGVFLKTKIGTGETFRGHLRKDALNEYNDWAMMKNERLLDDNMVRRLKKEGDWGLVRMI